ncbi:MAG: metal-dependent transcriptional regulator [Bacteroidetes bacterium]|nr:metal-dependent transcriptional regulator [Bacteroidota bacterium]MCL5025659.1 metal-dependent transcriptional regulator [Chloroflexota bacterium]
MRARNSSPIIEEYLETIYKMERRGVPTLGIRLAERMGVSAPTVTGVLKRMAKSGLVEEDARKGVRLTLKGRELGEAIVRKHRLAERLLTDVLGLDLDQVHTEACRFEHAISPEVEERLVALLGHPTTCPHGYAIPGTEAPPAEGQPLATVAEGTEVVVLSVPEEDPALLKYLKNKGIRPGARVLVVEVAPFRGPLTVCGPSGDVALGIEVAGQIWVQGAA